MDIFENKFNYQVHDSAKGYWIFTDSVNKKYKFYFRYSLNSEIEIPTQLPKHWRIFNRVMISSIIIIIFLLINTLKTNISDNNIYDKYYSQYTTIIQSRSISTPSDSIQIALEKINNKKYDEALYILNKIKNKDAAAFFYIGVLNQESGEYTKAIEKYQTIINNNNTLLVDQSKWYKGLCYIKMHKNKKALEQFKELSKSNSYYKTYADEIIKKLE